MRWHNFLVEDVDHDCALQLASQAKYDPGESGLASATHDSAERPANEVASQIAHTSFKDSMHQLSKSNLFDDALGRLDKAIKFAQIDAEALEKLRKEWDFRIKEIMT